MSDFNILLTYMHLTHKAGSKDYDCYLLTDNIRGHHLVVFRYGKVGSAGQIIVQRFTDAIKASGFIDKKIADKRAHGYSSAPIKTDIRIESTAELSSGVGRSTFLRRGKDNLEWLHPNIDVTGVSLTAAAPLIDENGTYKDPGLSGDLAREMSIKIAEEQALKAEEQALKAKAEREEAANANKNAPNWGMF